MKGWELCFTCNMEADLEGVETKQKDGIKCLMGPQAESHSGWGQDCGVRREEGFKRSQIYAEIFLGSTGEERPGCP